MLTQTQEVQRKVKYHHYINQYLFARDNFTIFELLHQRLLIIVTLSNHLENGKSVNYYIEEL